jgi:DNA-binding response OmpR family regulator
LSAKASKTILFVEDDENDVLLVQRAFEKAGLPHRIVSLETSLKTVDYLAGRAPFGDRAVTPFPDLLLLDLKLVGSSGFEVLEWLQGRPERQKLPVVIFSSSWVDKDLIRARELQADEYLVKPNGFDQLMALAREIDARWLQK